MPYSESLAGRIRDVLADRRDMVEKKLFGGVGFMLGGNMCVGVWKTSLIVRLGPEQATEALKESFVSEFDITGRAMRGWVLVEAEGVETDQLLADWTQRAIDFVETLPPK